MLHNIYFVFVAAEMPKRCKGPLIYFGSVYESKHILTVLSLAEVQTFSIAFGFVPRRNLCCLAGEGWGKDTPPCLLCNSPSCAIKPDSESSIWTKSIKSRIRPWINISSTQRRLYGDRSPDCSIAGQVCLLNPLFPYLWFQYIVILPSFHDWILHVESLHPFRLSRLTQTSPWRHWSNDQLAAILSVLSCVSCGPMQTLKLAT